MGCGFFGFLGFFTLLQLCTGFNHSGKGTAWGERRVLFQELYVHFHPGSSVNHQVIFHKDHHAPLLNSSSLIWSNDQQLLIFFISLSVDLPSNELQLPQPGNKPRIARSRAVKDILPASSGSLAESAGSCTHSPVPAAGYVMWPRRSSTA